MRKAPKIISGLTTLALLLSSSSLGLTAPEETNKTDHTFNLDQVMVTATKTEKSAKDVPAGVTIITAEDLKKNNVKTLDQALMHIPGLYIKPQAGMKATKISIRGLSQNRVLVLLDGLPLNNGYTGGVQWATIPLDNIERIEIVRGPFSTLYGSSAMGGVVNIITKQNSPPQTTITAGFGEENTRTTTFNHNDIAGKLEYYVDFSQKETDGYITNPAKASEGKFGWDNDQYNVKMIYHLNPSDTLIISKGRSDYNYQYQFATNRGERVTEILNVRYQSSLAPDKALSVRWGELEFSDYWTVSGSNYSPNPAKSQDGDISLNWQITPEHTLTLGVSAKLDQCDGKTYRLSDPAVISHTNLIEQSGGKTKTQAVYLQDEIKLNLQAALFIGGRYDYWRFYDGYNLNGPLEEKSASSFSPKASLVYKGNRQTTWYLSGGKSFTSPTIFSLARLWDTTSTLLLPNPDLKPEKATSYEFGVNFAASPNTAVSLAVFRNNVRDMIYQSYIRDLSSTKQELQWKNAGEAEITGLEVELNRRFTPVLTGFANYTHNNPRIIANSDASLVGKQIPTVPRDAFNLGLTYEKGKVTANLQGGYVSRTYESDKNTEPSSGYGTYQPHFVADTKVSYRFTPHTTLSLAVNNIFNQQYYQEILAPGRTAFIELTQKF